MGLESSFGRISESSFESLFPHFYHLSLSHNTFIESFASFSSSRSISCNRNFLRNLNGRECLKSSSLMSILNNVVLDPLQLDKRCWVIDFSCVFPCKSFFCSLVENCPLLFLRLQRCYGKQMWQQKCKCLHG